MKDQKLLKVVFISTYPPRECGIATYTRDLIKGINYSCPSVGCSVIALNDNHYQYPQIVKDTIDEQIDEDYKKAADFINSSLTDLVSLQHEYGIFGGGGPDLEIHYYPFKGKSINPGEAIIKMLLKIK